MECPSIIHTLHKSVHHCLFFTKIHNLSFEVGRQYQQSVQ